jgi:hypothetical protein
LLHTAFFCTVLALLLPSSLQAQSAYAYWLI